MIDKNALSYHYGENWEHIQGILQELTLLGFWDCVRQENVRPISASVQSTQDVQELASQIQTKRIQNAVLWTLEHEFQPPKNERT